VGGTKCHGVCVDSRGHIFREIRYPTPPVSSLVDVLLSMFYELEGESSLGVGVPGLVTPDGTIMASPHLPGANNFEVAKELRTRLGINVHVENDATMAAFAEWKVGAAAGARNAVMVTLGTGIGGGIVMGGQLQRGAHGFAGEIGHVVVQRGGAACPCGQHGCWERYASGSALQMLSGGMSGEDVFAAFRAGDAHATRVVEEYAEWVAIGLAGLANTCDPEVIVIGGGVVESFSEILPIVHRHFIASLYSAQWRTAPRIELATLGPAAGAIGCALIAGD
jgi:glucokinase